MFRTNRLLIVLAVLATITACKEETSDVTTVSATTETTATTASQPAAQPLTSPQSLTEGFSTPESVLYDADQDVYFISNINGSPLAADDHGYISRVNADTLQVESKWLDASKGDIELNAPQGMAIVGDDLWVSDIDVVRRFDRRTGKTKGPAIKIPGATFLNDVAADGANVYVSDSGMKAGANGFDPTGTDAVWLVSGGAPKKFASGKELNRPNGLAVVNGAVWAVSFGANELFQIENAKKGPVSQMPKGSLDGLVALADGSVLVSSWEGKAVYRGNPGAKFEPVVDNVDSPADLGYDTKRHRLLVPHFMENRISLHPLQ
jgi:sugar lactone lactonase YvrE